MKGGESVIRRITDFRNNKVAKYILPIRLALLRRYVPRFDGFLVEFMARFKLSLCIPSNNRLPDYVLITITAVLRSSVSFTNI